MWNRRAEQVQQDAVDAAILKQQSKTRTANITPDVAVNLSRIAPGGEYTKPDVKAAVGLSGAPVDAAKLHQHTAEQALKRELYQGDAFDPKGAAPANPNTGQPYSLVDLFRVQKDPVNRRRKYEPDWYNSVDPTGFWRNLPVPDKITNARELLNLDETQVIKLALSTPVAEWNKIPDIKTTGSYRVKASAKKKKTIKFPDDYEVIPGKEGVADLLKQKFPNYAKIAEAYDVASKQGKGPNNWWDAITQSDYVRGIGAVASLPADIGSAVLPDQFEPVAAGLRGLSRTITTPFVAGAQYVKNNIEYALTHPSVLLSGPTPTAGLFTANPLTMSEEDQQDYYNTVVNGNILTQIAKQVYDSKEGVDLGEGFFPMGKAYDEAIKAHDLGLPKIDGRTWTLGRQTVDPLVRMELIDRDSFVAKAISGFVDATFTTVTDPSLYFDPVQSLMKLYKLDRVGATALLNSREADIVREAWAKARQEQGLSTVINEVFDMVFDPETGTFKMGAQNVDAGNVAKLRGMLPEGTVLPDEVERVAQANAAKAIEGKALAGLDSPPEIIGVTPDTQTPAGMKASLGLIDPDGTPRPDPMRIDFMPFDPDGRRALNKMGSFENAGQLWLAFNGDIPPGAVAQIQDIVDAARKAGQEVDINAIHKVLVDGVMSADPMFGVADVPGVVKSWVQDTGTNIARKASRVTRQLATMPGSTFFTFDDPMSSLKDMNRIMIIMKVPLKDREIMLSKAIDAVVRKGAAARFDLASDFMETVMTPALLKRGVSPDWVKQVTAWRKWDDAIRQYTLDRLGEGFPALWMGADEQMMRSFDFFNSGFMMADPDTFRQMIRETSSFYWLLKGLRGNRVVENMIEREGVVIEKLNNFQAKYLKPVALGAPLPIRMAFRIVPDEMLRVGVQGGLGLESLKILSAGGRINYDTHGRVIRTYKEISKLFPKWEHLSDLYASLEKAITANDGPLARAIKDEIDVFEAKHGTLAELDQKMADYRRRAEMILPGLNRTAAQQIYGLMGPSIDGNPTVFRYVRKNIVQHAYRDQNPDQWVIGVGRDLAKMHLSPEYKEVARVLLQGTTQDILDLPERLVNGDLKWVMNILKKGWAGGNPLMPIDSLPGATELVKTIVADLATRTGNDPVLISAVLTGKIGNSPIYRDTLNGMVEVTASAKEWLRENFLTNPNSPPSVLFHPTEASPQSQELDRIFTKLFSVYRDASAKYARTPLGTYEKWKKIVELMPIMDSTEAQKLVSSLEKTDVPEWFMDRVRRAAKTANGTAKRKEIEVLAETYASKRVTDVLYDSSKQSFFGSSTGMFFGFFDAWVEQWSVWGRQIAEQPTILAKAGIAEKGLRGSGVIAKDEETGQTMIPIPLSRQVMAMIGLNGEKRISTKNLTLLGQAIPGLFGYGGIVVDSLLPNDPMFGKLRSILQPYGQPSLMTNITDYLVPASLQSIGLGALGFAKQSRVGKKLDLVDNLAQMITGSNTDEKKAVLINSILTNVASNSGTVPLTSEERVKLLDEVDRKANWMLLFDGLLRIFSPAVPLTKMFTDAGDEMVPAGEILDDFRKMQEETGDWFTAADQMLRKYGTDTWVYLSGASVSTPGMQPTKEYAKWFRKYGSLVDKYPNVGGYLGPQTGEYDPAAFREQRTSGYRKPQDITARQDRALSNLASVIYRNKRNELLAAGREQGLTDAQTEQSPEFKARMKEQKQSLIERYPMWSSVARTGEMEREWISQSQEIDRMVKDKNVLATNAGKGLKKYWDWRTKNIAVAIKQDPRLAGESWKTLTRNEKALELRWKLAEQARRAYTQYPEFKPMWDQILSDEFDPVELGD